MLSGGAVHGRAFPDSSMPASNPRLAMLLAALAAIGPFSIDTYLPAFLEMAEALDATQLEVQQTLTAYMVTFAAMALWHGAFSDRFGRRNVILVSTSLFGVASLLCAFATSIEWLWAGRALQGMSAGAGMVVGRAVIRDLFDGPRAQKLMSRVMMIFGIAPAVAPMVGGLLLLVAGWRSIFVFLAVFAAVLVWASWHHLPETLPPEQRQSLHPGSLARAYGQVLSNLPFVLLVAGIALNFNGFFLYVLSAPVFVMQHLGLGPASFGWLFVPAVIGMMGGSWLSGRVAGQWSGRRTVAIGFVVMFAAVSFNVLHAALFAPSLPWSVLPVGIYTFGMALAMPTLTLFALDLFPARRGLASSCQSFAQVGLNALTAGIFAPLLWASPLSLGAGASLFVALGLLCFVVWASLGRKA
jgi:DHA1 family bicyclomycin/chloramphenicol resistance-like MFS transporter